MSSLRCLLLLLLLASPLAGVTVNDGSVNVVVIVLDDLGMGNAPPSFGIAGAVTPTFLPELDVLMSEGKVLEFFLVQTVCSSTRSLLMFGRYAGGPNATGIGSAVFEGASDDHVYFEAARGLVALPRVQGWPYLSGFFGKQHGGGMNKAEGYDACRVNLGFDYCWGINGNLKVGTSYTGDDGFYSWKNVENGALAASTQTDDVTVETFEAATSWWLANPAPKFAWIATNASHDSTNSNIFECGDSAYHSQLCVPATCLLGIDSTCFRSLAQVADTLIGDFVEMLEAKADGRETYVFFTTDNGSDSDVARTPCSSSNAKQTVYSCGTRVPAFWWSTNSDIPSGAVSAHLDGSDLFPTVLEIAGVPSANWPTIDGVSMAPYLDCTKADCAPADHPAPKTWVYTEKFKPNTVGDCYPCADEDRRRISNGEYAYLRRHSNDPLCSKSSGYCEEFFDVTGAAPYDATNLCTGNDCVGDLSGAALTAYTAAVTEMDSHLGL